MCSGQLTQQVLTKGRRQPEGLYVLKDQPVKVLYSSRQQSASDDVWHQRLGHPNSQILQLLKNNKAIISNKSSYTSFCEPCQMGKSSRFSFSDSDYHALEPLERIIATYGVLLLLSQFKALNIMQCLLTITLDIVGSFLCNSSLIFTRYSLNFRRWLRISLIKELKHFKVMVVENLLVPY